MSKSAVDYSAMSYAELKVIARELNIKVRRSREQLALDVKNCFAEYETYKKEKLDKYTRIGQLGERGKEGTTYLVETQSGSEYAMKTFRKQKSSATLRKEAELQKMAADYDIAPNVVDFDTVSKYIVMEKMDRHLFDVMKRRDGVLSQNIQKRIISIYRKLDEAGVFHGDANLMNYMFKGSQLYIIDFGMAREITTNLINKLGTTKPNMQIMTLGLVLKLRELKAPAVSYSYLIKYLTEEQCFQFGIKKR